MILLISLAFAQDTAAPAAPAAESAPSESEADEVKIPELVEPPPPPPMPAVPELDEVEDIEDDRGRPPAVPRQVLLVSGGTMGTYASEVYLLAAGANANSVGVEYWRPLSPRVSAAAGVQGWRAGGELDFGGEEEFDAGWYGRGSTMSSLGMIELSAGARLHPAKDTSVVPYLGASLTGGLATLKLDDDPDSDDNTNELRWRDLGAGLELSAGLQIELINEETRHPDVLPVLGAEIVGVGDAFYAFDEVGRASPMGVEGRVTVGARF